MAAVRVIKAFSLFEDAYVEYIIPSVSQSIANYRETYGEQYDPVEKEKVRGGIPFLWTRKGVVA